jgi:hypothetical protein
MCENKVYYKKVWVVSVRFRMRKINIRRRNDGTLSVKSKKSMFIQ